MNIPIETGSGPYIKLFCIKRSQKYVSRRDRVLHAQTHKDNPNQTFVTFLGPKDESMFATLDLRVDDFFTQLSAAFKDAQVPTSDVDEVLHRP